MKKINIPFIGIVAIMAFVIFFFYQKESKMQNQITKITQKRQSSMKNTTQDTIKKELKTLFKEKNRQMGIVIGTSADDVLKIRGKSPHPVEKVGKDINGLIVEWKYPDGTYVFRIWTINGVSCYRVTEMKL